jgi:hypothetical protein
MYLDHTIHLQITTLTQVAALGKGIPDRIVHNETWQACFNLSQAIYFSFSVSGLAMSSVFDLLVFFSSSSRIYLLVMLQLTIESAPSKLGPGRTMIGHTECV